MDEIIDNALDWDASADFEKGTLVRLRDGRVGRVDRGGSVHDLKSGKIIASSEKTRINRRNSAGYQEARWSMAREAADAGIVAAVEATGTHGSGLLGVPDALERLVQVQATRALDPKAGRTGVLAARFVWQAGGYAKPAGDNAGSEGNDKDTATLQLTGKPARAIMEWLAGDKDGR